MIRTSDRSALHLAPLPETVDPLRHRVSPPEFISIPEWGRRLGISKDSAYKAARLSQIPGCFAVGRLYRVNWSAFVERSALAGGQQGADELGGVAVASFDHVRVDPQRGACI
jgi:hypothetical protein